MISQEGRRPAKKHGTPISKPIPTGELHLHWIRSVGDKALVVGRAGDHEFTATLKPVEIQSFARFQSAVFSQTGCWPRCSWIESTPARLRAGDWAEIVEQAIYAGRNVEVSR
jgi:hypothetical protein